LRQEVFPFARGSKLRLIGFENVLLDAKDPRRVLARTDEGFLHPDLGHEKQGQVANVVFVEGLVPFRGRWLLYFGAADSRLAVAAAPKR
jgi:predicted GH43/DUF377 family glycosyl hydrolase